MNGFEFLSAARLQIPTIVTTAYPEQAARAFEYNVLDFLVKPVSRTRLAEALHRVRQHLAIRHPQDVQQIYLRKGRDWLRFSVSDVRMVESVKDQVVVYTRTPTKGLVTIPVDSGLKEIKQAVHSSSLVRTHRSYLVNLNYVQLISGNTLRLADVPHAVPIGRAYVARVRSRMNLVQ
jgi:DNA-binding LytR/AlgR family response regulator